MSSGVATQITVAGINHTGETQTLAKQLATELRHHPYAEGLQQRRVLADRLIATTISAVQLDPRLKKVALSKYCMDPAASEIDDRPFRWGL